MGAVVLGWSCPAAALDLTAGSGAANGCPPSGRGVAATIGAVAWLQPAPVAAYDNYGGNHYAPDRGNDRGIAIAFSEISGASHGLCLGVVYRHDYWGFASKDILDVLNGNYRDQLFDPARSYALAGKFSGFETTGLRLRKVLQFDVRQGWSLKVGAGVSLLYGLNGQRQSVSGDVTATSEFWARGAGVWDRIQSNIGEDDFNPYVKRGHPRALGYSTDLQVLLRTPRGWQADLTVMDAYGRLHWRDLPRSVKTLDNNEIGYNLNLDQNAAITGIDSIVSMKQRIEPKMHLAVITPPLRGYSVVVSDDVMQGLHFAAVGLRRDTGASTLDVSYDLRTQAVTLALGRSAFRVALSMDGVQPGRANVLGLAVQAARVW